MKQQEPFSELWREASRVILKSPYTLIAPKDVVGNGSIFKEFECDTYAVEGDIVCSLLEHFGIEFDLDRKNNDDLALVLRHLPAQAQTNIWSIDLYGEDSFAPNKVEVLVQTDRMISLRLTYYQGEENEWVGEYLYSGEFLIDWSSVEDKAS